MKFLRLFLLTALLMLNALPGYATQDDPVLVHNVTSPPTIDGLPDDYCWQDIPWQVIDQVWIPYGTPHDEEDFAGRYKVLWSEEENLLYFLAEVEDDVFVDGFVLNETTGAHNFDVLEVFLDEDRSGGKHVFDATGATGEEWGTNAENAFAYHIYTDISESGVAESDPWVHDMDGTGWGDNISRNYVNHFPEYALRREGNRLTWEFSLEVYNDEYEYDSPEGTRVTLSPEKEMGFSIAYCDNDDPDEQPKERDSFFGSVEVPAEAYNDHWINADWFGLARLVDSTTTKIQEKTNQRQNLNLNLYPNPGSSSVNMVIKSPEKGRFTFRMYNLLGELVYDVSDIKSAFDYKQQFNISDLARGIYFVEMRIGRSHIARSKLVVTDH
ncbi:MAG: T9SS type A sorting domain-containing protein [Candidatus Marinimicrobia bacterium]|nr:T9SS type A sorting domain-containing protein [Candidatus Neomarinimicrobiota bacterium]MCF7827628.1 T9SS type A sorting domain-containing protein [Candidatus Neomarinimicrobiota bacterium]MCF7881317.1 T9SS type A sorting domain-containing protein [Candidatus Neomarinimicrobiota bacterium]